MTKKIVPDSSEAKGEGTRVQEFARIERETAPETEDPKVMAMTRAREEKPRPIEPYLRAARESED